MGLIHVANYVVIDRNWWQTSFALYKYASLSCINSKVAMIIVNYYNIMLGYGISKLLLVLLVVTF